MTLSKLNVGLLLAASLGGQPGFRGEAAPANPEKLTITQAVEIAVTEHPTLRAAREQVGAAQARLAAAKSRYRPQVRLDAIGKLGLSGATNALGLVGLPASPFYRNLSDAANVSWDIFDFGRTRHSVSVAHAAVEAAEETLQTIRLQVARRAKEAFLRVLGREQLIQVKQEAVRERREVLRKADQFYRAGLSSKLDVDLAQVGLGTAETELVEAQTDAQVAWVELFAALGRPEGEHYELVSPELQLLPPGELSEETSRSLATRPDLKALEAEIKAQEERLQYARSLRRPLLRGVWSGGYARFADLTLARLMVGGLGLLAPVYTGGELEAQIQEQQRNLEALRARYSALALESQTEVSRAHADVVKALESANANQKISVYAKAALRLARTRYEVRLASFLDVLAAETAAEEARARHTQALYDYQAARARLNAAMGLEP